MDCARVDLTSLSTCCLIASSQLLRMLPGKELRRSRNSRRNWALGLFGELIEITLRGCRCRPDYLEPRGSSGAASCASGFSQKSEHAQQHSDMPPRGCILGTRCLSGPLANSTEGNIILAQLFIQRIIKFIDEQSDTAIDILLAVFFVFLQLE